MHGRATACVISPSKARTLTLEDGTGTQHYIIMNIVVAMAGHLIE